MFSLSKISKPYWRFLSLAILLCIVSYSAYLILGMIKPGHDWGGDFALYINQCVHLSSGAIHQLHARNTFAMQHSLYEIGPYLYPQGFPMLLLPVYWIFGLDLFKMKIYCALFFVASLFLLYKLLRPHFRKSVLPLIIIAMIGVSPHFIELTDNVLSEFPFIFFVLLSFQLLQKERTFKNQVLLGLTIFFTYLIRDIGICLLAVLIVDILFNIKTIKKSKYFGLIPFACFAGLFLITKIIFPDGGANHIEMFLGDLSWDRIDSNRKYYTELLSNIFILEGMKEHVGNKILLFVLLGSILSFRKTYRYFVFLASYIFILLLWPSQESFRFLLPILGFILFFLAVGIERISSWIKLPTVVISIVLLFFLYPYFMKNIEKTKAIQGWRYNQAQTSEMNVIYNYINTNTDEKEIIGFVKPRVLTLFTERQSIFMDVNSFDTSVAELLLVPKNLEDQSRKGEFRLVQDFENYYLLSKK